MPAQASVLRPLPRAASICERCQTAMPFSRAATSSGFFSGMAVEMTTASMSSVMFALSWPIKTVMPASRSALVARDSFMSEPLTCMPRALATSAMPDMPTPPIPMK